MKKNIRINYKVVTIIITCIIIFICLFMVVMMIKNLSDTIKENEAIKEYSIDEINQGIYYKYCSYDYNEFYTIENITDEIGELISNSAYQDLCALMDNEIIYNKSEKEITDLLKEYHSVLENSASVNSWYLSYVYEYSTDMYLCKINVDDKLISLLLRLDENAGTYKIVFIEDWS